MNAAAWRRRVAELAAAAGARMRKTRSGHFELAHPAWGERVYVSSTPGDARTEQNTIAQIRRAQRAPRRTR